MNYKPLPSFLTIAKSGIDGLGIFATSKIEADTVLGVTHIEFYNQLIRTPLGGFYNHSDTPNCRKETRRKFYAVFVETQLVTLRDIAAGEEITATYTLYKIGEENA